MKEDISVLIALQELDTELSGFDRKIEEKKQELVAREQAIAEKEALAEHEFQRLNVLEKLIDIAPLVLRVLYLLYYFFSHNGSIVHKQTTDLQFTALPRLKI